MAKMSEREEFHQYESEGQANKLVQKSRDSPFVPIGKWNCDVIWEV